MFWGGGGQTVTLCVPLPTRRDKKYIFHVVFVLTTHVTISDTEFYFRNVFYFLRHRGRNNIQNMTVIISGNDNVLYSMLKVSNVSLNIILCDLYSHSESNNRYFSSDLENKLKQTCGALKLWTHCKPTRVFHTKEDINHSLTQDCSVRVGQ